jgi:hypothetical protein
MLTVMLTIMMNHHFDSDVDYWSTNLSNIFYLLTNTFELLFSYLPAFTTHNDLLAEDAVRLQLTI